MGVNFVGGGEASLDIVGLGWFGLGWVQIFLLGVYSGFLA